VDGIIFMSLRPDGSVRKEYKIKPGYVEQVDKFVPERVKNKGVIVGYTPVVTVTKSKEATEKAQKVGIALESGNALDIDPNKEAKRLNKKLRQIQALLEKSTLTAEELEKVKMKESIQEQLQKLTN
jgi:succinylglutamate desuccinylase